MIQIPVPDFRWGSSLMGVRMRDLLLSPPSMWAEFFWCTCLQSCLQTSTPTHKKSYTKFQNPREIFGTLVHPKSAYCTGKEGSPKYFFIGILIFLWVRSPCKISQRNDKPQPLKCHIQCFGFFGGLVTPGVHPLRSDQKKKTLLIVDTCYVCTAIRSTKENWMSV